jgi:telomerase protein component 1
LLVKSQLITHTCYLCELYISLKQQQPNSRYPSDAIKFSRSGLLGVWDESRAGKRMKLKIPETWETQVSMHGNKASIWEQLIGVFIVVVSSTLHNVDNKKLPFMAMLRNIRNLIKAGVSSAHHNIVLKRLKNERQVINSRQFPFRFFSAYQVRQCIYLNV